jgi:hypothetical protein
MYAESSMIYIESRAVIRFFTLKGLKTRAIHIQFESVYGPAALALPTVKKWRRRLRHGRTDLFDDSRSGRLLTNDLAGAIGSTLEERPFSSCKVLCLHFRVGKVTCLRILHDKLRLKNSILAGCHMPYRSIRRVKIAIFEATSGGNDRTEGEWLSADCHGE